MAGSDVVAPTFSLSEFVSRLSPLARDAGPAAIRENQLFYHFFPKSGNNDVAVLLRYLNWSDEPG